MSQLLFNFIEKNFASEFENFALEEGQYFYIPEQVILLLRINDEYFIRQFESTVLSHVSEQILRLSPSDYTILTSNFSQIEAICNSFASDDKIQYKLDNDTHSLLIVGLVEIVNSAMNNVKQSFFYQYPINRAIALYFAIFPSILKEYLPQEVISLVGKDLIINPLLSLEDCKELREVIKTILDCHISIPFPNFVRDLLTSYLAFLKERKIPAAIYYEDATGKVFKKFRANSTPMIYLKSTHVDEVSHVFHQPSESRLKYTRAGFKQLVDHTSKGFISSLETSHHLLVQVFPDFVSIRGCLLHDVEAVERKLLFHLQQHVLSCKHISQSMVASFDIIKNPDNWTNVSSEEVALLEIVHPGSFEWDSVISNFKRTQLIPKYIARVQNRQQWYNYQQNFQRFISNSQEPNELTLFHGTRKKDPDEVVNDLVGLDFRFSRKGLWGFATYFADDVRLANYYCHNIARTNLKSIFQVKVIAGNIIDMAEDDSLVLPPIMPGQDESKIPRRFDTVSGDHLLGYKNYMLYCNERVYPEYLITYVDENYVV